MTSIAILIFRIFAPVIGFVKAKNYALFNHATSPKKGIYQYCTISPAVYL
jgi:hypothetical protein